MRTALLLLVSCAAPIAPPPTEPSSPAFLATPPEPATRPTSAPPMAWRAVPSQSHLFTVHVPDEPALRGAQVSDLQGGHVLVMQVSPRIVVSFHVFIGQSDLQSLASKPIPGITQTGRTTAFGVPALLARGESPCPKMAGATDDCRTIRFQVLYVVINGDGFVIYSGADASAPALIDLASEIVDATTFDDSSQLLRP